MYIYIVAAKTRERNDISSWNLRQTFYGRFPVQLSYFQLPIFISSKDMDLRSWKPPPETPTKTPLKGPIHAHLKGILPRPPIMKSYGDSPTHTFSPTFRLYVIPWLFQLHAYDTLHFSICIFPNKLQSREFPIFFRLKTFIELTYLYLT